jgi:hypothetical protein
MLLRAARWTNLIAPRTVRARGRVVSSRMGLLGLVLVVAACSLPAREPRDASSVRTSSWTATSVGAAAPATNAAPGSGADQSQAPDSGTASPDSLDLAVGLETLANEPAPLEAKTSIANDRLVLALYYPWYNAATWSDPVLSDRPMLPYDGSDPATITRHVRWANESGIDVLVSAWFGPHPPNPTEANFKTLLNVAGSHQMQAALLVETDSDQFYPRIEALRDALTHALAVHATHPAYFRFGDKPVLVFWRPRAIWVDGKRAGRDGPESLEAWRKLRDAVDPERRSLWIAEGEYIPYLDVFDGLTPYSVAWAADPARQLLSYGNAVRAYQSRTGAKKLWVATAMPGYDDTGLLDRSDRFAVRREDGTYYQNTFAGAVASRPDWISISSFNEWIEGHQIEPSATYGDLYLKLTQQLVAGWKHHE